MNQAVHISHPGEYYGYHFEDLMVGMAASFAKTITEADIVLFAGVSGDTNPVHLNQEFASTTLFQGCIAHGLLSASIISAVLGTKLPGPGCIYISQTLRFKGPVRAGDTITARVFVTELLPQKRHVVLGTSCTVRGRIVLDGNAEMLIPESRQELCVGVRHRRTNRQLDVGIP